MGVSDGVEDEMMDEETRRAMEMSDEELDARFVRGKRTPRLARREPKRLRSRRKVIRQETPTVEQASEGSQAHGIEIASHASVTFEGLERRERNDQPIEIRPSSSSITVQP